MAAGRGVFEKKGGPPPPPQKKTRRLENFSSDPEVPVLPLTSKSSFGHRRGCFVEVELGFLTAEATSCAARRRGGLTSTRFRESPSSM